MVYIKASVSGFARTPTIKANPEIGSASNTIIFCMFISPGNLSRQQFSLRPPWEPVAWEP
jgi:hypothetical protein